MNAKPILSPLREADQVLAKVAVPHHLTQRLRWSMMRRASSGAKSPRPEETMRVFTPITIAIAAVTVFVMSMVVWVARRSAGDPCVTMHPGGAMSLQGSCALDLPSMRIESDGTAHLRETAEGIRLL